MQAHWKAIAAFSIALLAAFGLAVTGASYAWIYGLMAVAAVFAFAYLVAVARFDGRPSDTDEDQERRAHKPPMRYEH